MVYPFRTNFTFDAMSDLRIVRCACSKRKEPIVNDVISTRVSIRVIDCVSVGKIAFQIRKEVSFYLYLKVHLLFICEQK